MNGSNSVVRRAKEIPISSSPWKPVIGLAARVPAAALIASSLAASGASLLVH